MRSGRYQEIYRHCWMLIVALKLVCRNESRRLACLKMNPNESLWLTFKLSDQWLSMYFCWLFAFLHRRLPQSKAIKATIVVRELVPTDALLLSLPAIRNVSGTPE